MEAIYAHYPGLIVLTPATVEDAYSMLLEAVAIDDPVIFCEHKFLYYHLKAEKLPSEALPVGKARIAREGRDMTIVAYSAMVHEALEAAKELSPEGWEVEVVDLRSVKPLDTDTVMASVARTGRLLCVGEAWPWGGVTAEVIARVTSEGFGLLDYRHNGSMPRTLPCRIIRICGRRIVRRRTPSPTPRENCSDYENQQQRNEETKLMENFVLNFLLPCCFVV